MNIFGYSGRFIVRKQLERRTATTKTDITRLGLTQRSMDTCGAERRHNQGCCPENRKQYEQEALKQAQRMEAKCVLLLRAGETVRTDEARCMVHVKPLSLQSKERLPKQPPTSITSRIQVAAQTIAVWTAIPRARPTAHQHTMKGFFSHADAVVQTQAICEHEKTNVVRSTHMFLHKNMCEAMTHEFKKCEAEVEREKCR